MTAVMSINRIILSGLAKIESRSNDKAIYTFILTSKIKRARKMRNPDNVSGAELDPALSKYGVNKNRTARRKAYSVFINLLSQT